MLKGAEFKVEKKIVRVPTDFVVINNVRHSWQSIHKSVEILRSLNGKPVNTELAHLSRDWVRQWEAQHVIVSYDSDWDNDGRTVTEHMVKQGPAYKQFFVAWRAFEAQMRLENAQAAREARRAALQSELRALDAPAKARPAHMKDPFYDSLFEAI